MSGLTWDNIDDWVAEIPKDNQGHFINNQKRESVKVTVDKQVEVIDANEGLTELALGSLKIVQTLGADNLSEAFYPTQTIKADLIEQFGTAEKIDLNQAEQHYDPLARAKAGLATLDTSAAEQEMVEHGEVLAKVKAMNEAGMGGILSTPLGQTMTPANLQNFQKASVERAKLIVAEMDSALETGGRVAVSEKQLFNCSADLNQLIPFKYRLPWELYLKGCEHHWMPAEYDLQPLANVYAETPDNLKKLMARMRYTYKSMEYLFNPGVLLNIYSKITNPECRQYILRQAMEGATLRHSWMDIEGTLKIQEYLIGGKRAHLALSNDNDTFKYRHETVMKHIGLLHQPVISTDEDNLPDFMKAFIVTYGYVNFIMPVVSYYQVLRITESLPAFDNLNKILWNLIRDVMVQFEFAKFFVSTAIKENPVLNTGEFKTKVLKALKTLIDCELDLVPTIQAGETAFAEVHTVAYSFMEDIYQCVDSSADSVKRMSRNDKGVEFVKRVRTLMDAVNHNSAQGSIADSFD